MCDAAAAIAAKSNVTLVLVHACEAFFAVGETLSHSLHIAARDRLTAEAERLRQKGVTVEEQLLEGPANEAILELCERLPVSLVVMASQKKRELPARWFFGGKVEQVIRNSKVPTLIVRDPEVIENWLLGKKPLRVFVAVNLSSITEIPLLWVKQLAQISPCEITVAYLNWIPDEAIRLGLSHVPLFEESRELQAMIEHELRERCSEILCDLPVRIRVEPRWDRADLPLIDMAEIEKADLFVVGSRLRSGFSRIFGESVSVSILHNAPMGVVVVPLLETAVQTPLPVLDRVLVATDFTDAANLAIRYACTIVSPGGTIHLVHVRHRFGLSEEEATDQLRSLIPREAKERGIHFETAVWNDNVPANGITTLAARLRSDVICIGSKGCSGIVKNLLGSTAQAVLANSTIPVLLTRKPV
jgi:nucleotide-binding universal stress UspA family protein